MWRSLCWRCVVLAIVVGVIVVVAIASVIVSVLVCVVVRYPAFAAITVVCVVAHCTGVVLRSLSWATLDGGGSRRRRRWWSRR